MLTTTIQYVTPRVNSFVQIHVGSHRYPISEKEEDNSNVLAGILCNVLILVLKLVQFP